MPDTGAPWNIPYVAASDLVKDWPTDNQTQAEAIAAGLDLIRAYTVTKTDIWSASLAAGASADITDLSITHTVANASNKVLLLANVGLMGNSDDANQVGIAFADGGTLVGIGAAAGSRTSSGFAAVGLGSDMQGGSLMLVYTPGDTSSHTYTVRAINIRNSTKTIYVNRQATDTDSENVARAVATFTLIEVAP